MAYNNADQAVILPNTQLPLGQVMQNNIALSERQQARQDQLEERRYETDQRNEAARLAKANTNALHNLGTINKYIGEFKPIQADVDELVGNEMKEYKAFLMQNIGKDPIELDRLMSEKTPVIANAYGKMKNDLALIKDQEDAFLKAMPNADPTAVREVIRNQFRQKYTGIDANGKPFLKDPMNSDSNYIKIFDDPEKLSWVVGDNQAPLKEFFDKIKYSPLSGSDYKNNQGNVIAKKWQGQGTNYSGVVGSDERGNPKIDVAYEEIPMKNGTLQIANETLRNDMQANPAVEKIFDIAWLRKKKEKGLTGLDPATDEKMKEAYRLDYARNHIKHQVNVAEVEKTPKINISVGGNALNDAVENNSGVLKEHLENAIQNNPQTVYTGTKNGNQTWGDLGQSDLTTPFKINVDVKTTNDLGETKTVNKSVPFDKYFVTPDNKIIGAYYKRDEKNNKTSKMEIQKEIPIKEFTKRLVSKTTSPKTRQAVVDANVNEVLGSNQSSEKSKPKESAPKGNNLTMEQWGAAWTKLKKGGSMVGLDGKVYIKK